MKAWIAAVALVWPVTGMAEEPVTYILTDAATVHFTATVNHAPYQGRFPKVSGEIVFSPDHLDRSTARASIDLASVKTDDADSEEDLRGDQWFDVHTYAVATFTGDRFEHRTDDGFRVLGTLDLHGMKQPVGIDFTVKRNGNTIIEADGAAEIDRRAFAIGAGDWAKEDTVGGKVKIDLTLPVTRK